jgi:protein-disulfide isomerase
MKTNTIYIIVAVVALALILMLSSQYLTGMSVSGTVGALTSTDYIQGNKDAKTVLIEYGDYQCPACSAYDPMVKQVVSELGQNIAFSFRHFPLPQHINAPLAAYAAEAAGAQGKYWEMHSMLYEKQTLWAEQTNARDHFISFAKDLGLDVQKFQNDLDSQAIKEKVQNDLAGGRTAGVDATPTFYVNGNKVKDMPKTVAEFKALLQAAGVSTATTTAQ